MTAELVMSLLALVASITAIGLFVTLLSRGDLDYASRRDLRKLNDHVTRELGRLQYSVSQLYRYVEAVDDHTGARGYLVFSRQVHGDDTEA